MTNHGQTLTMKPMAKHLCPIWMGYFLASGLRKFLQNPAKIINGHVKTGMTALDFGSAMGFFSLPMARAVGATGKVVCVDLQPRMLNVLRRRAKRAKLADRIETHVCGADTIGLDGQAARFDFALAFAVLHETPDQDRLLAELAGLIKSSGRLLIAEPASHVTPDTFEQTLAIARRHDFTLTRLLAIRMAHAALLTRMTA